MADLNFQPLFSKHAIERCAVSFIFQAALPAKLFVALKQDHSAAIAKLGFNQRPMPGINIDASTGNVSTSGIEVSPALFTSADNASALIVGPNSLTFQTSRYARWQQFMSGLELLAFPLIDRFLGATSGQTLRLEYTDCFLWPGTWKDLDSSLLLGNSSDFVSRVVQRTSADWHSNCGWVEDETEIRHIKNVNIAAVARPGQTE